MVFLSISIVNKSRLKLSFTIFISILIIYLITNQFRGNILFQAGLYTIFLTYYLLTNREQFKNLLGFTKFLLIIILVLHTIFFGFKSLSMGLNYATNFYLTRWESIIIRIFIIPNIFAYINLIVSKFSFLDLILMSNNNNFGRILYILMISGIEVADRIKIHYEYHPFNMNNRKRDKIIHYLAVPLTLFFGIYRGFETKYKTLQDRDRVLRR